MLAPLSLHNRPSGVVQDNDMRAFALERLRGDHEDAPADLRHWHFPKPLQAAHVAIAQSGVDRE
jgi:hypothetical protein